MEIILHIMSSTEVLEHFVEGPQDKGKIVIFLQGWPDNHNVWKSLNMEETLPTTTRLFINFPNTTPTQPYLKWGQDFPVLVERIKASFDQVGVDGYRQKMLVGHDWGAIYAHLYDKVSIAEDRPILER